MNQAHGHGNPWHLTAGRCAPHLPRRACVPCPFSIRHGCMVHRATATALLQVAHNYEERGHRVRIFTARLDDRYGRGFVTSRLGPQREVEQFDADTDFTAPTPSTGFGETTTSVRTSTLATTPSIFLRMSMC